MLNNTYKEIITPILSLFTSLSTLICCALPVLFVTLGMGATLVSVISVFPWITIISKYKIYIFILAGLMLILSIFLFWQARNNSCPIDSKQAQICSKMRLLNAIILIISTIIFLIGFFFAFLTNFFYF